MTVGRFATGLIFAGLLGFLTGCAAKVATPTIGAVTVEGAGPIAEAIRPAAYPQPDQDLPLPTRKQPVFQAGDTNALSLPVDAALAEAYQAFFDGDGGKALASLDKATSTTPLKAYHLAAQRFRTLIMMGRASEAEEKFPALAELERAAMGTDVNALALRAEARLWLGDYPGAEQDALTVAKALQGWVLPSSYAGPPTNMAEIVLLTTAQLRAYTILAGLHVLQGDGVGALPWADAAEAGYATYHAVAAHPLYGIYVKPYPESYYGRAFNKLFQATAKALAGKSYAAGEADFAAARAFCETIAYRAGSLSAAALESWTLYTLDQDRARALARSEEAVQLATDMNFPDFVWRISALRGEMLLDEGRLGDAEAAFRRADASVDLVTGALATDRAKLRYGVGKATITYRLTQFDMEKGDYAGLFRDLEQGRARAFADMLADRPVAAGRSAGLVTEIRQLDDKIRQARLRALAPNAGQADQQNVAALTTQRDRAVAALRDTDPELADVHAATVSDMAAVQGALADGDALVYALPSRDVNTLHLLILTRSGATVLDTRTTATALRTLLIRFRESIQLSRRESQMRLAAQLAVALKFDDWRPRHRLYVVPTGDLFFLPWGALPSAGQTIVLPTGSWLLRKGGGDSGVAVGLIGDPTFGGDVQQLPGAREEVKGLGALYKVSPLIAEQATKPSLRKMLGKGASVLHIATHGQFDAEAPLQSAVLLSDGTHAEPLTAAEIFADPLNADLVVLSACETGMGEAVAGDDFLGLARSFYLGGTRSVVNSLWPISDEGTRLFMQVFHESALDGDYAKAWLTARDHVRDAGYPPSVYGAFILGGAAERSLG